MRHNMKVNSQKEGAGRRKIETRNSTVVKNDCNIGEFGIDL